MSYSQKTWANGVTGGTALDAPGLNDWETRIATGFAGKADLVSGKVPSSQIPALVFNKIVVVGSQAAMLALTTSQVGQGDIAARTDGAGSFMLSGADPSVLSNWVQLPAPTDSVTSVNGHNGVVTLSKADLSLGNVDNTSDANKPVSTAQAAADTAATAAAITAAQAGEIVATLAASATSTDTYLQLTTAFSAVVPQLGSGLVAPLLVDSEWMLATVWDSTNFRLYVSRGRRGTSPAAHTSGARLVMPIATAGQHAMHSGRIIDRVESWFTDTAGVGSYAVTTGGNLVIPPNLPFSVEYETEMAIYQNNAVQFATPNIDVRVQNSAGTAVGVLPAIGDGTWRLRHQWATTGGIVVMSFRGSADFDPLAAGDIYSVYVRISSLGTPTSNGCQPGGSGPQIFTARAL